MSNNTGALSGVRVLDLSRVLAGPYATQILGDHGAEIIKVEPPLGDETREWGPPFRDDGSTRGPSAYYTNINRNKRGIALDLTKPEAREIVSSWRRPSRTARRDCAMNRRRQTKQDCRRGHKAPSR